MAQSPQTATVKKFYTIKQTMELLCISRSTLYRQLRDGLIPSVHVGAKVLIPSSYFEKLENGVSHE